MTLIKLKVCGLSVGVAADSAGKVKRFQSTLRSDHAQTGSQDSGQNQKVSSFFLLNLIFVIWSVNYDAFIYCTEEGRTLSISYARLCFLWMFSAGNRSEVGQF
jgi:hypothetical protein